MKKLEIEKETAAAVDGIEMLDILTAADLEAPEDTAEIEAVEQSYYNHLVFQNLSIGGMI